MASPGAVHFPENLTIVIIETEFCEEPTVYPYDIGWRHCLLVVVPVGQTVRMVHRIREWKQQLVFERMEPHGGVS